MKTKYICKCGRVVEKSTTAATTGNRDTAGCEGCPYLLPWGPMIFGTNYDGTKGYHMEIHGYECRMSPTINYASEYRGQARDKCTLRIASLDLDLLDEIQSWIYDNAADTLRADFSRGSMRGTNFSDQGRYSLSISCAQNKKGMAAKAALIQRFFDSGHHRLDKTPEEEKAIVLAAIEEGKAAHQRKKENMRYTISENLENDCVYAYAAKEFWVYDKQACRWYTSGFCREQYERAKQKLSRLTPEDFLADSSDYSLLDDYEIPSAALNALQEAVKSGKREVAPFEGTNPPTPADADASPCAPGASDVHPEPADSEGSPRPNPGDVYRSAKGGRLYKIGEHSDGKKTYYRTMRYDTHSCTWEPANGSLYPELSNAQGEFETWIRTEQLEPVAPNGDVAASTAANAAQQPQQGGTPITPTNASSSSAPACPADVGAATQNLSAAAPASLAADPAPKFDFSALGDLAEQAAEADEQFNLHYGRAQDEYLIACIYMARVHELTAKSGRRGGGTWTAWYQSKGISEGSARTMVQNGDGFKSATVADFKNLPALTKKDLNLIARQGAAEQVLEAAKENDSERVQEILAQLKAEREAREQAEQQLADAQREHQAERESTSALLRDEQQRRQQAEEGRIAAEKETAAAQQRAAKAEAQGKKDAALVEKLQNIVLQRDNEVAEQKERADAAEIRAQQAENRPVEVAAQAPDPAEVQRLASEKAVEMTAMLKAQLHTLQAQLDDAESRADAAANNAYMSAAEFAAQAAAMIDGIRASFWAMAKELPGADFNQALEPLDTAVSRIYNREWEDGWDTDWTETKEDNEQ